MTFYEAAIEVLRRSGRPLHYKKITELAIREDLLSHKGKTPEVTMSARLTKEVKREDVSVLERTRPGVYKLREEYVDELNEKAREREEAEAAALAKEEAEQEDVVEEDEDEEEEEEAEQEEAPAPEQRGSRRRGRRGRRGRGRRRDDDADADSDSGDDASAEAEEEEAAPEREESSEDDGDRRKSRGARSRGRRGGRSRGRKNDEETQTESKKDDERKPERASRDDSKSSSRSRSGRSRGGRRSSKSSKHLEAGPVKLEGFAEAAYTVLSERTEPMSTKDLADEIFERKLVRFHTHDATMTVQAALVTDNQRRKQRGHRKLFIAHAGSRWGLTEWGLSDAILEKEQRILSLSEECRQEAIGLIGDALLDVAPEALEHVTLTLLEGLGYSDIKVSKRSSDGDVFFTADLRQGLSDVRVCIQVVADGSGELGPDVVTGLRGTLHHYSAAEGVIVHLGEISKQAVDESREEKLAAVTLIDRTTFVTQLVDQGIGVTRFHTPILLIDTAFLEQLKNV